MEIAHERAAWHGAEKMAARKAVEKPRSGKVKNDFPTPLGNPANPAGFPLSHSLGDYGRLTTNRTFHLLRKGDTSNVVSMGTFLLSVDIEAEARDLLHKSHFHQIIFAFIL